LAVDLKEILSSGKGVATPSRRRHLSRNRNGAFKSGKKTARLTKEVAAARKENSARRQPNPLPKSSRRLRKRGEQGRNSRLSSPMSCLCTSAERMGRSTRFSKKNTSRPSRKGRGVGGRKAHRQVHSSCGLVLGGWGGVFFLVFSFWFWWLVCGFFVVFWFFSLPLWFYGLFFFFWGFWWFFFIVFFLGFVLCFFLDFFGFVVWGPSPFPSPFPELRPGETIPLLEQQKGSPLHPYVKKRRPAVLRFFETSATAYHVVESSQKRTFRP